MPRTSLPAGPRPPDRSEPASSTFSAARASRGSSARELLPVARMRGHRRAPTRGARRLRQLHAAERLYTGPPYVWRRVVKAVRDLRESPGRQFTERRDGGFASKRLGSEGHERTRGLRALLVLPARDLRKSVNRSPHHVSVVVYRSHPLQEACHSSRLTGLWPRPRPQSVARVQGREETLRVPAP